MPFCNPCGSVVKNPSAIGRDARDTGLTPGAGRSQEEEWQPTPVFLPGKSRGPRRLAMGSQKVGHDLATEQAGCN